VSHSANIATAVTTMGLLMASPAWIAFDSPANAGATGSGVEPALRTASGKARDVIYKPTPQAVVDRMLELAALKEGDVLYDLGCGDGRIVVTAAKRFGVKGVGIDIDAKWVQESRENARKHGVDNLVSIRHGDIFQTDIAEADVVTMYLLPTLNAQLRPRLAKLKPGARVISHSFDMKGAKPEQIVKLKDERGAVRTIFVWVVPFRDDGR
jgi:precorrin-6B methylase 2